MPKSDRHRNRKGPVKGRKPSRKKQQPAVEIPHEDIKTAVIAFKKGGVVLYPSDTVYAIGCDATNHDAVEKLKNLKEIKSDQGLIMLVDSFNMLDQYVEEVPDMAWEVLKHNKKPLTIIYDKPKGMAENVVGNDDTIAIRVTNDPICKAIIKGLRKPIISSIASIKDNVVPLGFYDIELNIKDHVDHIVDLPLVHKNQKLSSILKLSNDGVMKIVRK